MACVPFRLSIQGKMVPVEMPHCRDSTLRELRKLGTHVALLPLARYRGELYDLRPVKPPLFDLVHARDAVRRVALREVEAVFAGRFEVRFQGNWYTCSMVGGRSEADICVIAEDPDNRTKLSSPHSRYMWGSGVELNRDQIEAVRLWLSDPMDPVAFEERDPRWPGGAVSS